MSYFNISFDDIDIKESIKSEFTQYKNQLNEQLEQLQLFLDNNTFECTISLSLMLPKTFDSFFSNQYTAHLYYSFKGSYIKICLENNINKVSNNIDNFENLRKLCEMTTFISEHYNLSSITNTIEQLKNIAKKIKNELKKGKVDNFKTFIDFYKKYYVNESDPTLINKNIMKLIVSRNESNKILNLKECNCKNFIPIILPDNNSFYTDNYISSNPSQYKKNDFYIQYIEDFYNLNKNIFDIIPLKQFNFFINTTQENERFLNNILIYIEAIRFNELQIIYEKNTLTNELINF